MFTRVTSPQDEVFGQAVRVVAISNEYFLDCALLFALHIDDHQQLPATATKLRHAHHSTPVRLVPSPRCRLRCERDVAPFTRSCEISVTDREGSWPHLQKRRCPLCVDSRPGQLLYLCNNCSVDSVTNNKGAIICNTWSGDYAIVVCTFKPRENRGSQGDAAVCILGPEDAGAQHQQQWYSSLFLPLDRAVS